MEIIGVIIGGFLAAGAGWFVQHRIEVSRLSRQRKLFIQGIRDDLLNSIELYNKLAEDWQRSKHVWFNLLSELVDSRHTYVKNRDFILLIGDDSLRQKISEYYRKSAQHLLSLRNAQQRKYDIENKYAAEVKGYLLKNPETDQNSVENTVANAMDLEGQELQHWNKTLPTMINSLGRFRGDAKEILKLLDKA